ncbi:electron transfer flavoprotein beta subunit [Silvibacterium bohemicum]|uniref:Electron transfer flavoprotein subunit beta n=1 Tax=Silvibacterium bohemicum TaxID=1577686 RepID=A0A841JW11_9BACT|nr:electron transfer flavoprotein subunit beta/FixA family protein [Silvibacterium bohemicum]MBB6144647.1 electron transfer flavoprotein beta subunit [Silvibacterium bohemicum]
MAEVTATIIGGLNGVKEMRMMTLIRQVLDAEQSVRTRDGAVDLANSKLVMDTMDEYGLEEALRLREGGIDAEVIAVGVGPARLREALRTALAMGADRAVHVETEIALDPIALSKVVAEIARQEQAELILCGGQQADWDSQALGAATAERLNWPQVTWTSALSLQDSTLTGKHDVDEGREEFSVALPAVITTQQGLNDPRYPTLPNILKAKKKELRSETLEQFQVQPMVKITGEEIQVKERLRKILDGKDAAAAATELLHLLRDEARVIA